MSYAVLVRINDPLWVIGQDSQKVHEFATEAEAEHFMDTHPLFAAQPYQVVEVEI